MTRKPDHIALDRRFATIDDLARAARARIPAYAHDYLTGGIGNETCLKRNRKALDAVTFAPDMITGPVTPDLSVEIFGQRFDLPVGIAPIGLSGLIWPRLAEHFAASAVRANIPAILSTVATTSLEKFAKAGSPNAWFQLYVPNDDDINRSLIERARTAGYEVLVVTVDVPALGRRPRDIKNGLSVPPRISLSTIVQSAMRPRWAIETLLAGMPEFENLTQYVPKGTDMRSAAQYTSALARGHVGPDKLKKVRDLWPGKLVVKGIMSPNDARTAIKAGADAVYVSNHGGRQLDAARSPVEVIADIAKAAGPDIPVFADSGIRSGLDAARMLAAGASFTFAGRPFAWGAAALGPHGVDHVVHILENELQTTMTQLGCPSIGDLKLD